MEISTLKPSKNLIKSIGLTMNIFLIGIDKNLAITVVFVGRFLMYIYPSLLGYISFLVLGRKVLGNIASLEKFK